MYLAYWGLGCSPFRGNFDPRFFFEGPSQEEALARLNFMVDQRRALGLLLGESGSGKSQLLELFGRRLGRVGRQVALVQAASTSLRQFLWTIASQLGAEPAGDISDFALVRLVTDHLVANRYQQLATILLVDDAELAASGVHDEIMRLAELDGANLGLTIILAAQTARLHRLGSRILELADLRIDLDGWEADDTAAFIKGALAAAGRSTPIFSDAALASLHELSSGVPRRVKQLADLALLAGAGDSLVQIESPTVESVYRELGVITTVASAGRPSAMVHW